MSLPVLPADREVWENICARRSKRTIRVSSSPDTHSQVQRSFLSHRLVNLFLVGGHLIQHKIKPNALFYPRRRKVINLIDAYTASGVLAAQALPRGQYKPNAPTTARRYCDGLETKDPEEDTLFVVYYFPHTVGAGMGPGARAAVPSLRSKRKLLVFRARSKVERDLWCWAINTEIEKVARATKDREERLRGLGKVTEN